MNAKKLIAGGMAALMLAGGVLCVPVQALAETPQQNLDADKDIQPDREKNYSSDQMPVTEMQTEFLQTDELENKGALSLKNLQETSADSYNLAESEWAKSGGDYYFSLLNTAEKKLYLNLKKQADMYLTGTDNFLQTQAVRDGENVTAYILPLISYEGLTSEQMKKVFYCFMYENPQYYFMRNSVVYSENSNMMSVGLYEIFADGTARAEYTRLFAEKLKAWDEQILAAETVTEKERLIHQLVCEQTDYNYSTQAEDPNDPEMSQSCISAVLFSQSTVCAGYAQLFTLLCSRAGISCITVTSDSHAWNKVRMGNTWYNADCTWDDARGDDTFLNVTDEQLLAADTEKREHVMSPEWENIVPAAAAAFDADAANMPDTAANVLAPGCVPEEIVLASTEKGALSVSVTPAGECDGYSVQYAINGAMLQAAKQESENTSSVITGLKSGKTYYVRVRAYELGSNGERLYGAYSKKVKADVL